MPLSDGRKKEIYRDVWFFHRALQIKIFRQSHGGVICKRSCGLLFDAPWVYTQQQNEVNQTHFWSGLWPGPCWGIQISQTPYSAGWGDHPSIPFPTRQCLWCLVLAVFLVSTLPAMRRIVASRMDLCWDQSSLWCTQKTLSTLLGVVTLLCWRSQMYDSWLCDRVELVHFSSSSTQCD